MKHLRTFTPLWFSLVFLWCIVAVLVLHYTHNCGIPSANAQPQEFIAVLDFTHDVPTTQRVAVAERKSKGTCTPVGDLNCDSCVDFGDVNYFVQAVTDPDGYVATVGEDCSRRGNGDMNCDGNVNAEDINDFVEALTDPNWIPFNRPPVAYSQVIEATEDEPVHVVLRGFDPDGGIGCP